MRHFIIRTCVEHDYMARLTYESLKLVESDDILYYFSIEEGETEEFLKLSTTFSRIK